MHMCISCDDESLKKDIEFYQLSNIIKIKFKYRQCNWDTKVAARVGWSGIGCHLRSGKNFNPCQFYSWM